MLDCRRQFKPFPKRDLVFMCSQYKSFKNNVGKGEIACDEQFLLIPSVFYQFKKIVPFSSNLKLSSANSFKFGRDKKLSFGKDVKKVVQLSKTCLMVTCPYCVGFDKQEGHDGPVSLHWLIPEIHSYQTLHYLGIGLKHKTPYKDYIRYP